MKNKIIMKLNKTYLICLILAGILLSGVFVAQAVGFGFVSYEDGNKIILWDNVRLVNRGLRMSDLGVNDLTYVNSGNIDVADKDLFLRGFVGFGCDDYPNQTDCNTFIGDFAGAQFLKIDTLTTLNQSDLFLKSLNSGINLVGSAGSIIEIEGSIILSDNKGLVVSNTITDGFDNTVLTETLRTNILSNADSKLKMPNIFFSHDDGVNDAFFNLRRIINYPAP